jgi:predicted Zn-dependent protease with MMP-like domain
VLPDRIPIYRGPTLRMCDTREDVVEETEITVVHDIRSYTSLGAGSPTLLPGACS